MKKVTILKSVLILMLSVVLLTMPAKVFATGGSA